MNHEVNIITVLVCPDRGVLLGQVTEGRWGFPGSEDLVPGESWQETQRRGLTRDLGVIEFQNDRILHLESFPAGVVGPTSKFGVFVLSRTDSTEMQWGHGSRWCSQPEDAEEIELVHQRVKELLERALDVCPVRPK